MSSTDFISRDVTAGNALLEEFTDSYNTTFKILADHCATIVVVGATGCGKSSLINAIFGAELTKVGNGRPVTTEFVLYPATEEKPVNLYDSRGWEPQDTQFNSRIRQFVQDKMRGGLNDITKAIHCVWYVVESPKSRWTDGDTELVGDILKDIPVILVLNKCDIATEEQMAALEQAVNSSGLPNVKNIGRVSASPKDPEPGSCPTHGSEEVGNSKSGKWWCGVDGCSEKGVAFKLPRGIDTLVKNTLCLLPELVRNSFIIAQEINVEDKRRHAAAMVAGASLSVAAAGWIPLPIVDALISGVLVSTMVFGLAHLYGIEKKSVSPKLAILLTSSTVTLSASSFLKLIPGVGTVVGGLVDCTTSLIFTLSIGIMWIAIFSRIHKEAARKTADERTKYTQEKLDSIDFKKLFTRFASVVSAMKLVRQNKDLEEVVASTAARVEEYVDL